MSEYICYNGSRIKNLKGNIYGFMEPQEIVGIKNKYAIWQCKCTLCGGSRDVSSKYLTQNSVTMCKECARKKKAEKSLSRKEKKEEKNSFNRKSMYDNLDLTGKDFGLWHVKNKSEKRNVYTCVCRCGTIRDVSVYNLVNGRTASCGCARKEDITGKEFGFLKAIKPVGTSNKRGMLWECECKCGKKINVTVSDLGWRRSCGCMEDIEKKEHTKIAWAKKGGNKIRSDNSSGVSGVLRANGKWGARITFQKRCYWLGTFDKKEDAVQVRKAAEEKIFGDFLEWYAKEYPNQFAKMQKEKESEECKKAADASAAFMEKGENKRG